MDQILGLLGTLGDLFIVVVGFSFIIFIHELGHFLAARWAGIRVNAFAIGFGKAIVSYRRGFGVRLGSSESEYIRHLQDAQSTRKETQKNARGTRAGQISPTEYRLNWLPFGGYVKMLGQEDLDPTAVSNEPDSYQNCPPTKRMVVISAGVVANVILSAILFVIVFMAGLKTEPPYIGTIYPNQPAASAKAINADQVGADDPGLRSGDRIIAINDRKPNSFQDLMLASAMTARGDRLDLTIERDDLTGPLEFSIEPKPSPVSGLMQLGVEPLRSATLFSTNTEFEAEQFARIFASLQQYGINGLGEGMKLVRVADQTRNLTGHSIDERIDHTGKEPFEVEFESADGARTTTTITPRPVLQTSQMPLPDDTVAIINHLLGLVPVMSVTNASTRGAEQGLRDGDIFSRIGSVEYPSFRDGRAEIADHAGESLPIAVLRHDPETGALTEVAFSVSVADSGIVGFTAGDSAATTSFIAIPPTRLASTTPGADRTPKPPAAHAVFTQPGSRILSINDTDVASFGEIRAALRNATRDALASQSGATVEVIVELPRRVDGNPPPQRSIEWSLSSADIESLHSLGWESPLPATLFAPEEFILQADNPGAALVMGVKETNRVMLSTYLTLVRLFQGTVKVEHLKGPVGIAHMGTRIVDRGMIWLLFFMALISANLAVINFLPLPIVDGGQFIFLVIEKFRGKPVSVEIQNLAAIAGLMLIATIFLVVTYNDIMGLLGS